MTPDAYDPSPAIGEGSVKERGEEGRRGRAVGVKQLQDLGTQIATTTRKLADDLAKAAGSRTPEPMVRIGEQITHLSTLWVGPVQTMLTSQREFFELMLSWADQQREFADRMTKLAERNQQVTEKLASLLAPVLEQAETARKKAPRKHPTSTA